MNVIETGLPGVLIIEPKVFGDARGFFFESWNESAFAERTGVNLRFVQDNHSRSRRAVLRGLHYQIRQPQGKLVRAARGAIYDVAVDLRRSSPHFGKWVGVELSEENHRQLWVPPGFGHGFLVLSEMAEVLYKATDYYAPQHERSLLWNDAQVGVEWPLEGVEPVLSAKDAEGLPLSECEVFE
jgi:dTDP-4-dehydrorhamnose 3,5-epimerase